MALSHREIFSVFLVFVSSQSQLGGQLGEPFKEAGRASKEAGRALEPAGRALGPAGRALESAGRAMEPAGRALEPVKGSQGGMDGRTEKREKISIGHCP